MHTDTLILDLNSVNIIITIFIDIFVTKNTNKKVYTTFFKYVIVDNFITHLFRQKKSYALR